MTATEKYEKLTTRTIKKLSELRPGDHIRVQGEGGGASHSTSTSTSSSDYGKTKGKSGAYTHHLLVVSVIDEKSIEVIHHVKEVGICGVTKRYKPEQITVLDYDSEYTGQEAVKRARFIRINGGKYNLATNNCEDFVTVVRTGEKLSDQVVSTAVGGVTGGTIVKVGTVGTVGTVGASAGMVVGATIGTALFPIAGTIVGGAIGGAIGGFFGGILGLAAVAGGLKAANSKKEKEKKRKFSILQY